MTWYPTNTNDVTLIVSRVIRDDAGNRDGDTEELADTSAITVDDFTIGADEGLEGLSGIGNAEALGISQGDVEYTFSFTVQGEDAQLFNSLASDDGRANELEIIVTMEEFMDKLVGAKAGTRELSGSSGDPTEFSVEGMATKRPSGTV